MTPLEKLQLEKLQSVLCDPLGKCCIRDSDEDRKIVDDALAQLEQKPLACRHEWFTTGAMPSGECRCINCGVWGSTMPKPAQAQPKPLLAHIAAQQTELIALTRDNERLQRQIAELEAQLASGQEPVATVIKNGASREWMSERLGKFADGIYSLYAHPAPAQQPLNISALRAIIESAPILSDPYAAGLWVLHIVRAVEAEHGIKEKK